MTDNKRKLSRGRPKLHKVSLHTLVKPSTLDFIQKRSKHEYSSKGEVIDQACDMLKDSLKGEGWGNK